MDAREFRVEEYYKLMKTHAPWVHQLLCGICMLNAEAVVLDDKEGRSRNIRAGRHIMTLLVTLISIMVFSRSRKVNGFQTLIGYFLQGQRVSKRALSVCHWMGICVSYDLVKKAMRGK